MKNLKQATASLLLAVPILVLTGWAGDGTVQEQVVARWRERENSCTSFKIKWQETQTFVKGSLSNSKTKKGTVVPPDTTERDAYFTLCADGDKMKEISDDTEVTRTMELKRQEETTVFNGKINKSFRPAQALDYPQGFIGEEKHLPGLNVYNLRPILVSLRPFRYAAWGYFKESDILSHYKSVGSANIEGHKCIVLRDTSNLHPSYVELWLDIDREFVPIREITFTRGKPILQVDWKEYHKEDSTWVPAGWVIQELSGGLKKSILGKVLESTVNQTIPANEFEIEFPLGTWVIDRRNRDQTGNPSHYIVQATGKRFISIEELNTKTYDQLSQGQSLKIPWMIGLLSFTTAFLAIAFLYFRRRKNALR